MLALLVAAPSFMRRVDPAATLKPADGELVSSAEEAVAVAGAWRGSAAKRKRA